MHFPFSNVEILYNYNLEVETRIINKLVRLIKRGRSSLLKLENKYSYYCLTGGITSLYKEERQVVQLKSVWLHYGMSKEEIH